jgi:hypothetical protein
MTYDRCVSGIEYDYSLLNDPRWSSDYNQLSLLYRIQQECGQLPEYKEHASKPPVQACEEIPQKLAILAKRYANPKYPGILLIPQRKILHRNGSSFTYAIWNFTNQNINGRAKLLVLIKLNDGEIRYGNEFTPVNLMRGYNGIGQTIIYADIDPADVANVSIVMVEFDKGSYYRQY